MLKHDSYITKSNSEDFFKNDELHFQLLAKRDGFLTSALFIHTVSDKSVEYFQKCEVGNSVVIDLVKANTRKRTFTASRTPHEAFRKKFSST